jgi:uncharacterized protein (DUF1800 family)
VSQVAHPEKQSTAVVAWPAVLPPRLKKQKAPGGVPLSSDLVQHLLRRVTYGATDAMTATVHSEGVAHWLDQQLRPDKLSDVACSHAISRKFPLLNTSSLQLRNTLVAAGREYSWDGMEQLSQATLMRAVISKRQIFEVMVEFWNNHLNIACPSDKVWSTRHSHDRLVIRKHTFGRFEDMLIASAKSPAMLYYLDNADSQGAHANENYGRELLELHTLGVGNYSETDVHNSALAFTGWSVQDDESDTFTYKPGFRYVGALKVKGWHDRNSDPGDGIAVATSYLKYLAHHPATAHHIASKLAIRFVSDTPSTGLVNDLAKAYLKNDTQILPVLRTLFSHHEFWGSLGKKVRRPYEWGVATMRTLGYRATLDSETDHWGSILYQLGQLGQAPLAWPQPNGYADIATSWESTAATLGQWNTAISLVQGWWADGSKGVSMTDVTTTGLLRLNGTPTAGGLIDALSTRLLGHKLPPIHKDAVLGFYGVPGNKAPEDFQLDHGPIENLSALILSSPVWSLR